MSGLSPEKRMDKNGKLVTRHIKYDANQPAPKSMLPSVFGLFGKDERYPGFTKKLLDDGLSEMRSSDRKKLMSTLNDDTMRALHAAGVGRDNEEMHNHNSVFKRIIRVCEKEGTFALLNNIAFFSSDEGWQEEPHTIASSIGTVKGLIQFQPEGTTRIDYTTASEEELEEGRKMLSVTRAMRWPLGSFVESDFDMNTGEGDSRIEYQSAVELFRGVDRGKAMEIVEFAKERKMWFQNESDIQSLIDLFEMDSETHEALDDGVL